ncbi:acetyl coenzyme A synthetase (ADP forming)-like protein [Methanolinea mesophila]|uniref:acetate--CoA ligase family protein n=1 Tax=Methanolinea mesophila TaxID=547055 RepID=UPI001AE2F3C6|nr:acetate--CoA ligase family protein [Methanolinea mesophila]MBP1927500.1 acetyl coenzyme A synthetase (ADP forming)-like protein [Methanolinea mesophila]
MDARLLTEPEGMEVLRARGIPVPDSTVVNSPGEAEEAARRIGFPLVMKVVSAGVVHKSDSGGVIPGISSPEGAGDAYRQILARVSEKVPGAVIEAVIVERQMPPGLELIIGGREDPAFGKVITFGIGGTLVELIRDVALRVLPLSREEALRMVRSIRGSTLLMGYRGSPPLDENALVDLLVAVGRMFLEKEDLAEFDLNPVILYPEGLVVVDARLYEKNVPSPGQEPREPFDAGLFSPSSIAVIGASSDPGKVGYAVLRNLLPYPGTLYPVNPHHNELLGRKAYPSVSAIPGRVDAAVVAIPAAGIPPLMDDLGKKGVRLVIIVSSGFREVGGEGVLLEERVLEKARHYGMRVVGPNCLGVIFPHKKINTTFDPISPHPGHIGFISQSGAVITTVVDWSIPEGIGFSAVISVGNQIDLGFVDFIAFTAHDPETKAVILYIEELRGGREFLRLMEEVTPTLPVIALKSGSSAVGKKAAASHTGSLAGSFEIYQAAFAQSGVIPVFSLKEAFEVAELLASEGYPKGKRAVVITGAGGFGVLAADYAEKYGIAMAPLTPAMMEEFNAFLPPMWSHANPVDLIGDGGAERYAKAFDVLMRHQDEWDIAFVIGIPSAVLDTGHLAQEIVRFSSHTRKMVVGCLLGGDSVRSGIGVLRHKKIPNFSDLERAFLAVGRSLNSIRIHEHEERAG